jgi:hypothetical protein
MNYIISQGVDRHRLQALVSRGELDPVVPTEMEERRNRRTVTEVTGFVQSHPLVLDGEYARIVYRAYVSGDGPIATPTSSNRPKRARFSGPFPLLRPFAMPVGTAAKYRRNVNVNPLFGPIVAHFYGQFRRSVRSVQP